jgi:cysteine desulfurase/selenocysteine lyase
LTAELNVAQVRKDFPILDTFAHGHPLVYLDNGATSQKPKFVIDALDRFWTHENANVHRGVHYLSQRATQEYDAVRIRVRNLLNARFDREIIFTKGCTEAINLVAHCLSLTAPLKDGPNGQSWGGLAEGDEILVSTMEHHSNIVPWQLVADRVGARVLPIPITDGGEIELDAYARLLRSGRVRVVGIVHISNSLGTINPVKQMIRMAHEVGAVVLVDGAQAGAHTLVDVRDLDADFYTLACHKMFAPTGIGVLYGRTEWLEAMPPYQGGGDMIRTVSFERTTFAELPAKFEAGTPNIGGVVGLGATIRYLASLGEAVDGERSALATAYRLIGEHEHRLVGRATERLSEIPGVRITGTAPEKASIVAFTLADAHPHDVGTILDMRGIAVRAGHHCCMPLMRRLGVPATVRASFALYNTLEEVDGLVDGVLAVKEMFA